MAPMTKKEVAAFLRCDFLNAMAGDYLAEGEFFKASEALLKASEEAIYANVKHVFLSRAEEAYADGLLRRREMLKES